MKSVYKVARCDKLRGYYHPRMSEIGYHKLDIQTPWERSDHPCAVQLVQYVGGWMQ